MQGRARRARGITLIEASTVVAVAGIVVSTSVPGLQGAIDGRRLNGAATTLATDIQYARTEAVARNRSVRLSFHGAGDAACYVIHTGNTAQCTCGSAGSAVCSGGAEAIKTVRLRAGEKVGLQANVTSLLFDPLHGTSTPTGTLRLVGSGGREIRHVVNVMGRVRSCTPAGAVPGYPVC